ncbi:MAG: DUF4838 domain-containing protein [Kiritimatiellae bacterium]|nr:DUF4838 domain-containing protein [Kiritimatiellia bacterium]MDD5523289.1 DUF4838 domain-containing protein [Kiritimatiellia bacterium]
MIRYTVLGVVVGLACAIAFSEQVQALELVSDGQARATVVVPAKPNAWTKRSATWVVDYVKKATGAELTIVEEPVSAKDSIIAVGHTELAKQAGISVDGLKWDGGKLIVRGKTLYLLGRDEAPPEENRPNIGARGTCKTVATFLENYLGIRWIAPGPNGELVPPTKNLSVPDDLNLTIQPLFAYGHGRLPYGTDTPGAFANNFRTAVKIMTFGGHSWPVWIPAKVYGKDHPEYFYFDGKTNSPSERNHLCTTHPEVKEILLREIRKVFDRGYDWCQLAQSDGFERCQCPRCEALDNYRGWKNVNDDEFFFHTLHDNPCERVLLLHKAIIDECVKSHPDKKVHMIVYGPTSWPSMKFDRFGDNVISEVCHHYDKTLPVWRNKVFAQTVYVYFWGTYKPMGIGPKFTPAQVAENLRVFRDNNVIGIYYCGAEECWGLDGPSYYAAGRLMNNPDLPVEQIVKEYCAGLYGAAAVPMYSFFQAIFKRVEAMRDAAVYGKPTNKAETLYTLGFPPDALEQLDGLLGVAEKAADTERSRMWVKLSRDFFDYVKLTANMYHLYQTYKATPNAANFHIVKKAVQDRQAHIDKILAYTPEYGRKWFPGLALVKADFGKGGRGSQFIREPVTWNFEKMEKKFKEKSEVKP